MLHLFFPALLVGSAKRGIITMPIRASIQFFWNIAITAMTSVITLEIMLVKVLVTTLSTPPMSLVILVMMSP